MMTKPLIAQNVAQRWMVNNMQSEITLFEAVQKIQDFLPVKILFNGVVLYNDWEWDEDLAPTWDLLLNRLWQADKYIVDKINIEIVDFHHSIISMKGKRKEDV